MVIKNVSSHKQMPRYRSGVFVCKVINSYRFLPVNLFHLEENIKFFDNHQKYFI
jgi:hypothetical protein